MVEELGGKMKQKSLTKKVCENLLTVPPYILFIQRIHLRPGIPSPSPSSLKLLGIKENAKTRDAHTMDLTIALGPLLVFQRTNSRFRCKNIRGLATLECYFYIRASYRILPDDTRG